MGPTDKTQDRERRRFFRIQDSVQLHLKELTKEEMEQRLGDGERDPNDRFSLMTDLNAINQRLSGTLRRIEQGYPDIADYLKAIDQKLELLARALLMEELGLADNPIRPVNLSAGGISIQTRTPMKAGTLLEVKLLLLPSCTGILTYGEVVGCQGPEPNAEYPYLLRIDFSLMADEDRDALTRHITLKQAEWLRSQRRLRQR